MSSIALTIEMVLAMLLLAALFVGMRLERRLKALRDGEAGFAKAVSELNVAALRAEGGLAELKASIRDAEVSLADRLQDAKAAAARLQQNITRAGEASQTLEAVVARAASIPAPPPAQEPPAPAPAQAAAPRPAPRPAPPVEIRERRESSVFQLTRRIVPPPEAVPTPSPQSAARSRVRVDDDLFETPEPPPRLAAGGRR